MGFFGTFYALLYLREVRKNDSPRSESASAGECEMFDFIFLYFPLTILIAAGMAWALISPWGHYAALLLLAGFGLLGVSIVVYFVRKEIEYRKFQKRMKEYYR